MERESKVRMFSSIVIAIGVFYVCLRLPLESYGERTGVTLGFLIAVLTLMVFSGLPIIVTTLFVVLLGILGGFWNFAEVSNTFGNSPFLATIGMMIVAMGCEFTQCGKRIAYYFLYKLGHRPVRLVVLIAFITAGISMFVSNVATLILMSSIADSLLKAMGEKPGESSIGRAIMVIIPVFSLVGGMALISGSPNGNMMAINFLYTAAENQISISYLQWAIVGIPSCFILLPVLCFVYITYHKLDTKDIHILPSDYYKECLDQMGRISNAEKKWIFNVIAMVAGMMAGADLGVCALLSAAICLLPVVGVVSSEKVFQRLPFDLTIAMSLLPILGNLFTGTGIDTLVIDKLNPLIGNMSPLAFCIFSALCTGILVNVFVNAQMAASALTLGIFTPVCMKLGYNPAVIMMPSMMISSCFFCLGINSTILLNHGYGYWDMKDFPVPGFVSITLISILSGLISCFLNPVFGNSLYL